MILEHTSIGALAEMLRPHMNKSAWPGLDDPAVRRRARQWARKTGRWEQLRLGIRVGDPLPAVPHSVYRRYHRTGERATSDRLMHAAARQTADAALGLWLEHPSADVEYLQDLLWAWCDAFSWVGCAHAPRDAVDLFSTMTARQLAEILWVFRDRLDREVTDRVRGEIERRALDPALDWRCPLWWATADLNWNHVCNANLIAAALYLMRDPSVAANYIHPLCLRLEYALDGFGDDGSCLEGPGYWEYGFGHYLDAAVMLHHRTGGKLNLMQGEKIERICRYPLAIHIEGPFRGCFSDGQHGHLQAQSALKVNRFFRLPELYELAQSNPDGTLQVSDWRSMALYGGEKASGRPAADTDAVLPDMGLVRLRAGRGEKRATLMALAGRNDFPHNHNDIGSFIYYRRGACLLTDPGAPVYTRQTFSPDRYKLLFCSSRGHSVPLINGREQPAGGQYCGTLQVEGLNEPGVKTAAMDLSRAYDDPTLRRFERVFRLEPDGAMTLTDWFAFTRRPRAVEEAFITFEPVRVVPGGHRVVIGKGPQRVTLCAERGAGRFAVAPLQEPDHNGHMITVRRITFTPSRLATEMQLAFRVDPGVRAVPADRARPRNQSVD